MPCEEEQRNVTIVGVGAGRLILSEIADCSYEFGGNKLPMVLCDTHLGGIAHAKLGTKGILIGKKIFEGRGSFGEIEKCTMAALKERKNIGDAIAGSRIVIVATCLGGGTGSGIAPVVCDIAGKQGAFVIAVATYPTLSLPKTWKKTRVRAEKGLEGLKNYADVLMIVDNEKIRRRLPKNSDWGDLCTICNRIAARIVWDACQGKGLMELFEQKTQL